MTSVFSKIVKGEIPAHKVAEDENHIAFLDINPLAKGHTLAIPKQAVDYIFDLDEADFIELQKFARKVALAIDNVISCNRIGVAVLGLEVPHAHIHLVPIQNEGDLNFSNPRINMNEEELRKTARFIHEAFINISG